MTFKKGIGACFGVADYRKNKTGFQKQIFLETKKHIQRKDTDIWVSYSSLSLCGSGLSVLHYGSLKDCYKKGETL
jgi:hypothetical protein